MSDLIETVIRFYHQNFLRDFYNRYVKIKITGPLYEC